MSKAVTAADVMTNSVLALSPQTPLLDALRLFVEEEIHGAPVVEDDERPVGVLTTTDLLRAQEDEHDTAAVSGEYLRELLEFSGPDWMGDLTDFQDRLAQRTVGDAMTEGIVTVRRDAPVSEVARRLREHGIHRVWVEDDGRICGVVSTFDLLPVLEAMAQ